MELTSVGWMAAGLLGYLYHRPVAHTSCRPKQLSDCMIDRRSCRKLVTGISFATYAHTLWYAVIPSKRLASSQASTQRNRQLLVLIFWHDLTCRC